MKVVRLWIFIGICLLAVAAPTRAEQQAAIADHANPITIGESHTFTSEILDDVRQINVWLPTGYSESAEKYPVVYLLDGALTQDFHHIAALGQLASLSWTFGPMIIVGVESKERRAEFTPVATDPRYLMAFPKSGRASTYRKFLREEVIPFVEGQYRTGERRALMGESLAGLFVVDTVLSEPGLFQDYVAISPSLWWDDRRPMQNLNRLLRDKDLTGIRFYLAMAGEGGTMQEGTDLLRSALSNASPGVDLRYVDWSGRADHSTVYHSAAEDALRWLYPMPPYDYGEAPWYMIEGAAP